MLVAPHFLLIRIPSERSGCLSLYSYIKPQQCSGQIYLANGCLSLYSYIKPQLQSVAKAQAHVVYHSIPTSNHNFISSCERFGGVVYHSIPTSNHNCLLAHHWRGIVVYHSIPTSNHNRLRILLSNPEVVYHSIPTSNHNLIHGQSLHTPLFITLFLHQTTTPRWYMG